MFVTCPTIPPYNMVLPVEHGVKHSPVLIRGKINSTVLLKIIFNKVTFSHCEKKCLSDLKS